MSDNLKFFDSKSTYADSLIFGAFTVLGIFIQLLLRVLLDFEYSGIITTLLLACIMLGYAFLLYRNTSTKIGTDQGGDTLYFLGFIFTTVTLAIALAKFGDTEQELATQNIVGELGIGMSTTILGLVLRVSFNLTRTGTEEIEDNVASDLLEKSNEFSKKLAVATQLAEESSIKNLQILKETESILLKISDESADRFASLYNQAFSQLDDSLKLGIVNLEKVYERLDSIEIPRDIFSKKIDASFSSLDKAIFDFSKKIESMRTGEDFVRDSLTNAFSPISEGSSEFIKDVKVLNIEVDKLAKRIDSVGSVISTMGGLTESVANIRKGLEFDPIVATNLFEKYEAAGETYTRAVEGLSEKIDHLVMPDRTLVEILDTTLNSHKEAITINLSAVTEESEKFKLEIKALKESFRELASSVREMSISAQEARADNSFFSRFRGR